MKSIFSQGRWFLVLGLMLAALPWCLNGLLADDKSDKPQDGSAAKSHDQGRGKGHDGERRDRDDDDDDDDDDDRGRGDRRHGDHRRGGEGHGEHARGHRGHEACGPECGPRGKHGHHGPQRHPGMHGPRAPQGGPGNIDARIARLEQKIDMLLHEVRELRSGRPGPGPGGPPHHMGPGGPGRGPEGHGPGPGGPPHHMGPGGPGRGPEGHGPGPGHQGPGGRPEGGPPHNRRSEAPGGEWDAPRATSVDSADDSFLSAEETSSDLSESESPQPEVTEETSVDTIEIMSIESA